MSDLVLIPLNGEWLALNAEALENARQAARAAGFGPNAVPSGHAAAAEPLCDAATLAKGLGVPASWVEQAAREGRLPCIRLGRWVRFKRSAVEAALGPQPPARRRRT